MRSDPRQISLFDALELPAVPIPPPKPMAPAREKLSLDIGDTFLGWVTGFEYGDVCFWQRTVEGVGDGCLPNDCYVLSRFHADPEGVVYHRKVRSDFIERDLEWALETTLFAEAQSFFYLRTGNARPRKLSKTDILAKPVAARTQSLKQEPLAPVKAKADVSPEDVAYVETARQAPLSLR